MKKIFFCLLFFCLSVQIFASNMIYVSGRGKTKEAAILDALMTGVSRKNKTFITSKGFVDNDNYSGTQNSNSFGRIAGFEVIDSKKFDNDIQVQLAVSFQTGNKTIDSNQLSTQEIWNLAQQLKYFKLAQDQIGEIFKDHPFYIIQKKYSFQPIPQDTENIILKQELDIRINKALYQAQMNYLAALLNIYHKGEKVFSYSDFQKNRDKIVEKDKHVKKIYITNAKLSKTVEYIIPDQLFETINEVLDNRIFSCRSIFNNSENREVSNYSKGLDDFKLRYHVKQNNAIMLYPFFKNNANSISQEFKIKYKHSEIKQFNKCYVRYPIFVALHVFGKRHNNSVALLTINNSSSKMVEATGIGETAADAEKDALKKALLSLCGSAVSAKTIIKNDDIESQKIISKSHGIVQKYDVVR